MYLCRNVELKCGLQISNKKVADLQQLALIYIISSGTQLFLIMEVNLLRLYFFNLSKNISMIFPSSSIKIWGESVHGFMSYDWNKYVCKMY